MMVKKITAWQTSDGALHLDEKKALHTETLLRLEHCVADIMGGPGPATTDMVQIMLRKGGWRLVNCLSDTLRRSGVEERPEDEP